MTKMSAMMLSSQNLSSHVPASPRDVPLNAHLENLRDLAHSLLSEVQSLTELTPKISQPVDLKDAVQQFERELISAALERTRGNQSQAARLLGVKHTTLNAKVKRYQIR
jgi:DNA-binding NtrC family response regulator